MASAPNMLTRMRGRISEFSIAQRTLAIIGIAVLVLGGFALFTAMSQPRMSPVYTGLDPQDASQIVEQLRADGVPYELTAGGTSVLVPEEQVYETRIRAASAGLPSANRGGYSLLDDMGVTSSDFQQTVTYKRALEGELAGTIEALNGVQAASVALALPEETVFVDTEEEPTASIFVRATSGTPFTDNQVQSVVHLVAAAVDGLRPENVAVVDAEGTLLSAVGLGVTNGSGQASDYEERMTQSVQTMLDQVVGRGNATVAVNAQLSMESAERLEETFENPEEATALTESTITEEYTGTGGGAAGVLGPDNIAVPGGTGGEGSYTSEQSDRQNAVNKITETRSIPSGELVSQSVSVVVNADAAGAVDVPQLTQMVGAAIGLDEARGDQVSVSMVPFSSADADAAAAALAEAEARAAAEQEAELLRILTIGAAVVIGLLLLLVMAVILMRRRRRRTNELEDLGESLTAAELGTGAAHTAALPTPEHTADITAPLPPPAALAPADPPQPENDPDSSAAEATRRRDEINTWAAQDPERMAEHLRTLMEEESASV
ncbi:flagellar M-ring protein FliF [Nesterenkonia massiliensis]|uniref:Flagellar M-ring protein n=1 Tax=Nesterenkonia massiliensis TaxID=1232429 RepID=A0ABT2HNK6_9MICC|nr:flagellar basal-body MS-ring/collar protein FliF [Nesterenkonia massiliensis]MCT1606256.1 flagellar M-ring protein FliF [Nesterenkonia massiliensis]